MFFPSCGTYAGRIFIRSVSNLKNPTYAKAAAWKLLAFDSAYNSNDSSSGGAGEMSKGGIDNE